MLIPRLYFVREDEQLIVQTPLRRLSVRGPRTWLAWPLMRVRRDSGILLGPSQYARVEHLLTGEIRNICGPQRYFPGPDEAVSEVMTALPLQAHEYARVLDRRSGRLRVEQGEQSLVLAPDEQVLDGIQPALWIDEEHAVLIRNRRSGALELISEPQAFVPAADQEVVAIQDRIRLQAHECLVIRRGDGSYRIARGTDPEPAFFLPPYSERVGFHWSTGLHKTERSLYLTQLDLRPKFMWYEFEVRTRDNVELILGVTFFWQIADVAAMLASTDDAPGDLCSHARSQIIQAVSLLSLQGFLSDFNACVSGAVQGETYFYERRGLQIHAVEVRSIHCKDPQTQAVLHEIIQETTERLKRLQKQESENEVLIRRLSGEQEQEAKRQELLKLRHSNQDLEAESEGRAEALRIQAFFATLPAALSPDEQLTIYRLLRKQAIIDALSQSQARLYFTPADVNLSIETAD